MGPGSGRLCVCGGSANQGLGLDWLRGNQERCLREASLRAGSLGGPQTITHNAFFMSLILMDGFILTNKLTRISSL